MVAAKEQLQLPGKLLPCEIFGRMSQDKRGQLNASGSVPASALVGLFFTYSIRWDFTATESLPPSALETPSTEIDHAWNSGKVFANALGEF